MLAATDNFLYLKVSLKLMLWSHMPVCYYKFDITHESVFSSPSLLNEYLRYDKLWGPSQRVDTLFFSQGLAFEAEEVRRCLKVNLLSTLWL